MPCQPCVQTKYGMVQVASSTSPPSGTDLYAGKIWYAADTQRVMLFDGTSSVIIGGDAPRVSATRNTTQSVADATTTAITWPDTEDYDTASLHDTGVNPSRITIPAGMGGIWSFSYSLYAASVASACKASAWMSVGGVTTTRYAWGGCSVAANDDAAFTGSSDIVLAAGEYVEMYVYQDNTGATARNYGIVGIPSRFVAVYQGPS